MFPSQDLGKDMVFYPLSCLVRVKLVGNGIVSPLVIRDDADADEVNRPSIFNKLRVEPKPHLTSPFKRRPPSDICAAGVSVSGVEPVGFACYKISTTTR